MVASIDGKEAVVEEKRRLARTDPLGKGLASRQISRRELLRGAGIVAAAAAGAPLLAACEGGASQQSPTASATGSVAPKTGGRLVAAIGAGTKETLHPFIGPVTTETSIARLQLLYDRLAEFDADLNAYPSLAEEFEPNASADVWTVRLRRGVTWHDGKELTADDVVYSFAVMLDPTKEFPAAAEFPFLQPKGVSRVDDYTVRFQLTAPYADLMTPLAQKSSNIIPADFIDFDNPIGTGPFRLESWTPNESSLFVRNENYWAGDGTPYLDELEIVTVDDSQARLNGLASGQFHVVANLEAAEVRTLEGRGDVKVLETPGGAWTGMCMLSQTPPFDDPRVRQAMRLLVDRNQIIENALEGHGTVGNDLFSPLDPMYADDVPQREQDLDEAAALLKSAGVGSEPLILHTAGAAPAMLSSATLLAESARQAGVNLVIEKCPTDTYWDSCYLAQPFFMTNWGYRTLDSQLAASTVSDAPFNETEWTRPEFDALVSEARTTLDAGERRERYGEIQQTLWDEGGYIIWGFINYLDGYRSEVNGVREHKARNLTNYGFHKYWLA